MVVHDHTFTGREIPKGLSQPVFGAAVATAGRGGKGLVDRLLSEAVVRVLSP